MAGTDGRACWAKGMTELIPLEVLFGHPQRIEPSISPDGTQLGWIAPHDGVLNVWAAPVNRGDNEGVDWTAARVVTEDTDGRATVVTRCTCRTATGTRTGACMTWIS
jgi:hypothetical protein